MRAPLFLAAASAFVSMAVVFVVKTYADALFLAEFGAAYLPHFMVGQALALVTVSWGYGHIIKRGKTLVFDTAVLCGVVALALAAPAMVAAGGYWIFFVSLALIAGTALAQIVVWNAATAVASGRAARSFLPKAGAAATAGAVTGGFASSAIVSAWSLEPLVTVAAGLTIVVLVLRTMLRQAPVPRRVSAQLLAATGPEGEPESIKRLVKLLAAATVVEALVSAIVDFGFKREVEIAFGGDQQRMGLFLSLFYGTSNVLLLGVQLLGGARLLATQSLKFNLGAQPMAQAAASLVWVAIPLLPLATITRGLENVLKFGISRPAQEVALTPLREIQRKRWKVLLRGVFAQGGSLAAGLLLIALTPLIGLSPTIVPALATVMAIAWYVLQRRTADVYRETLGSALGLRRRLRVGDVGSLVMDKESVARVVEMAGSGAPETASLATELLDDLVDDSSLLATYLGTATPRARQAVYRVLATRPSQAVAAAVEKAAIEEPDDSPALGSALAAVAALGSRALAERAQALCRDHDPTTTEEPAASAWFYRASLNLASEDERDRFVAATIVRDGRRGAHLGDNLERFGGMSREQVVERVVGAIDGAESADEIRESLYVAARLGHAATLGRLLRALELGQPGAEASLAQLPSSGLGLMADMVGEQMLPPRTLTRFLRALRAVEHVEVGAIVAPYLTHEVDSVRDVATHTLLAHLRRGRSRPAPRLIAEALDLQLDRFEHYVRARPGASISSRESAISLQLRNFAKGDISKEAFFLDELDRRTERSLGRLADLLALTGEATVVYAAERALKSPSFKRRRQALDLLQETLRGRRRVRMLQLLDNYLIPSRGDELARRRVCEIDPWLKRCLEISGESSRKLWALRRTRLFDSVPGEAIENLIEHCELKTHPEDCQIVGEGDPGDALFVITDGAVSVHRNGEVIAQMRAGDAFGELALIDGRPREASVRTLQRCQTLRLPAAAFQDALQAHPELGLGLVRGLVQMLRSKLGA